MRYLIEVSYDGSAYHGWQIQKDVISVQQVLSESLSKILRADILTTASGRTDAGVHATMQFVHFDFEGDMPSTICDNLNGLLPRDIAVNNIRTIKQNASARFNAGSRAYVYKIHSNKNPFKEGRSYFFSRKLDLDLMNQCCESLKKWTDFECFSRVHTDVNTFNCEIFEAYWELQNNALFFHVKANRFLRGMVRAIVGTMLLVGEGKIDLSQFNKILESKDRRQAGSSVPACGLYLNEVVYPKEIYL